MKGRWLYILSILAPSLLFAQGSSTTITARAGLPSTGSTGLARELIQAAWRARSYRRICADPFHSDRNWEHAFGHEIIGHLADTEWVYGYRLRRILCEDNPPIRGTDQDLWVIRQQHNEREPSDLLEMFRTMRQLNLALWKRMSPADFERYGHHNERGQESLGLMVPMMAGHDLSHLDQIVRYIQAINRREHT